MNWKSVYTICRSYYLQHWQLFCVVLLLLLSCIGYKQLNKCGKSIRDKVDVCEYNHLKFKEHRHRIESAMIILDQEIRGLEARVDKLTEPEEKRAAQKKVEDFKRQRKELQINFTEIKYNNLFNAISYSVIHGADRDNGKYGE